jgi:hypothetical protein
MGYKITNTGEPLFEEFMQSLFPNFNLVALLKVVENQFTATTQEEIIREIFCDEIKSSLNIAYRNKFKNENGALLFMREFISKKGGIEIKHNYCVIPKDSRNNGLIKPVFQVSLQQYVNMDAKRILLHAGLSGGGYTWARCGFVAIDKSEVGAILHTAKSALNKTDFVAVKKVYDIYYSKNPNGKAFPMDLWAAFYYMKPILMGSDWHGELNLKNQEQFRIFKNYVSR